MGWAPPRRLDRLSLRPRLKNFQGRVDGFEYPLKPQPDSPTGREAWVDQVVVDWPLREIAAPLFRADSAGSISRAKRPIFDGFAPCFVRCIIPSNESVRTGFRLRR